MENRTFLPKSPKNIGYIVLLVVILLAFIALLVYGIGWGSWFDIVLGALGMLLVPFEMYGVLASKITFTEDKIEYTCGTFSRYAPNAKLISEIEYKNIENYDHTNTKKQLVTLHLKDNTVATLCLKQYTATQITTILDLINERIRDETSPSQDATEQAKNHQKVSKNIKKTQKNAKKR